MDMSAIAGIVPAAGASRRMGRDKRHLPFGAFTMLEASVKSLLDGGCSPVVVVLGPASSCRDLPLFRARSRELLIRVLDEPSKSMAYSIRRGLEDVPEQCEGIAVLPGDCPGISPSTIQLLNRTFSHGHAPLFVPTYAGQQGHPRYVGRSMFDLVRSLPDEGRFSDLFLQRPDEVVSYAVAEASIIMDVDTPDAYRTLLYSRGEEG